MELGNFKTLSLANDTDSFRPRIPLQFLVLLNSVQEVGTTLGMSDMLNSDVNPLGQNLATDLLIDNNAKSPLRHIINAPRLSMIVPEAGGKLGPHVKKDVESYLPTNITLTCSTSGKLSTSLNEYFLEKQVVPAVTKDFLWILDSWTGQTNLQSYNKFFGENNGMPEITVKIIPEKCLEVLINVNGISQEDNWTTRKGVLKLQSLLHFLISAPIFKPMIKYSWYSRQKNPSKKIERCQGSNSNTSAAKPNPQAIAPPRRYAGAM
ncbi:hypothetical protein Fcan01_08843 [Folsomia candida]|uniref:Uncharacterized protein n=1 Tax=Folsomia candida TaxID=158441 RepID=A0A226EEM4_FOLCA|nr:hypothetical protein Fcan01_08843 [Folsomia candida]